jgi:hypothetical protein
LLRNINLIKYFPRRLVATDGLRKNLYPPCTHQKAEMPAGPGAATAGYQLTSHASEGTRFPAGDADRSRQAMIDIYKEFPPRTRLGIEFDLDDGAITKRVISAKQLRGVFL